MMTKSGTIAWHGYVPLLVGVMGEDLICEIGL